MAAIHHTTLKPTKLELLTDWLPGQPWFRGDHPSPELTKAGGFRLDDPQGEVGIECLVVTDASGAVPRSYFVPLTYRGAPLDGAERALVGTTQHGVLGKRWIYDGAHDPVFAAELLALFQGRAVPQAQDDSDTRDDSVTRHVEDAAAFGSSRVVGAVTVAHGTRGTELALATTTAPGAEQASGSAAAGRPAPASSGLGLRLARLLEPVAGPDFTAGDVAADGPGLLGAVTGVWRSGDDAEQRGVFATLRPSGA
ncbi:maltokinase N-terminal cap-like domain-containing protein [Streptomyces lunalinharesii]|uniref:Maltokinase N-terminal cap domain-containing protein n=1 Tax=Streptomyces lunalinharesii TaxID=333384 RepID=A0ABP6E0Z9_9ACTN